MEVVAGLLILVVGLLFLLAWDHRERRFRREVRDLEAQVAGEARLRAALDSVQAADWELSLPDRCFHRTLSHERIFGYDTLLPKWDWDEFLRHVNEADRDLVETRFREALETETAWRFECRIVRRDGTPGWIMMAGKPVLDEVGRSHGQSGVIQDLTASKAAVQVEAEHADRFRTLIESLPHLFWTCLPDGSCEYLSPQWVNYTGSPASAQMEGGWLKRVHADDLPRTQEQWTASLKTGRLFNGELRIRRGDGAYRWFRTRALPMRNLKGQIIKWFGTSTDIEDLKRAEVSLGRSQQRLALHVRQTPLAVIEWDSQLRVTSWNPAAERIFGFTEEEACGRYAGQLIVPASERDRMAASLAAMFRGQGEACEIHENITKDGRSLACEWFNTPLMDDDGRVMTVASLAVDITERKHQEELREVLVGELESKNTELESLIYVASHDLRAPLVNVQGFSRRLEKSCEDLLGSMRGPEFPPAIREGVERILDDAIPKSLSFIRSGVGKMDAIINGLLRVSRLGRVTLNPERIDMHALIRDVLAVQTFQIQSAGATVQVDDLPDCHGDSTLMNQVFSNLVDNALKYRDPARPLEIHFSGRVEGRQAVYCVADTGLGIAAQHQDKIWEMFHRLNPDGGVPGDGLGLNVVRRILDRHHGRVWVESEPGQGSRFHVSLPAVK